MSSTESGQVPTGPSPNTAPRLDYLEGEEGRMIPVHRMDSESFLGDPRLDALAQVRGLLIAHDWEAFAALATTDRARRIAEAANELKTAFAEAE